MAFIIPEEDGLFRQRLKRIQQEKNSRNTLQQNAIENRIAIIKMREESVKDHDKIAFGLYLVADDIVRRLEQQRDENRPQHYDEEWNKLFCDAIVLLPEARRFADDCMMDCMKKG